MKKSFLFKISPVSVGVALLGVAGNVPLTAQGQTKPPVPGATKVQVVVKQACQPQDVEDKKYLQEKDQLGRSHADQHRRTRA